MEFPFDHPRQSGDTEEQYPPPNYRPELASESGLSYDAYPQDRPTYQQCPPPRSHHFEPQPEYPSVRHISHHSSQGLHPSYPSEFQPRPHFPSVQHFSHQVIQPDPPGYSSVQHVSHQGFDPVPSGHPSVQHVSHQVSQGLDPDTPEIHHETHHHYRPHLPSFVYHHNQEGSELTNKRTVRIYTKAEIGYSLTIRDGKAILARSNENDEFQHWYKDEKYSTRVKDEEGFPSFALVNKATGQAIKHSIGATHPVQLVPYNPDVLDQSILWTESKDLGDGFRTMEEFMMVLLPCFGSGRKEITNDGRLLPTDSLVW
uniref:Uncharacterized protein n=1 Tax=Nelumbo nucifera TaxID=4432 RepID=A0A822Z6M9_NELNU|nr:TPA_asm: hypothetical protein HUJ06_000244 [Nelumbo nucifera]